MALSKRFLYLTTPRMKGKDVYALEVALENLGYDCKMTAKERTTGIGIFGPACDAAVRAFQHDAQVDVYGKTCPDTLAALEAAQPVVRSFLEWLNEQVGNGYVWGAQGDNLTDMIDYRGRKIVSSVEEWIRRKETTAANAERAIAFYYKLVAAGKDPILEYDCSGLIVRWLMDNSLIPGDRSSRGLYARCTPITRKQLQPGNLVFRRSQGDSIFHVGVYIGSDEVIEAQGRDAGVVRRGIDAGGATYWTDYGILRDLQ